ncbi:MAG: hypothetical protein RL693_2245, partial [Verrucomicrobiota bacterium]
MSSDENIIWVNGRLRSAGQHCVSPLDRGFTLGDGVFETLRAYGGKPFAMKRHWKRLMHACETTGLPVPAFDDFANTMDLTLAANNLMEARVRYTVTSGGDPEGGASNAVCYATPV